MHHSIVINREFGSGGREIGRLIAERTGMAFYDSRILQEAATSQGLPPDLLQRFDERVVTGQYFDLSLFASADPNTYSLPYRMYDAIAEAVLAAARRAPAVFIGRCADRILRDNKIRCRSVFVYSTDIDRKITRAVEVDGIPPKNAEEYIAKMDRARSRYQQFFTGTAFGDLREYDLCLNSGRLSIEACVAAILASVGVAPEPTGPAAEHSATSAPTGAESAARSL